MRKKVMWLLVSCSMALSLVLASCAPAVVEEEEEVALGPEVPKYGGSFTGVYTGEPMAFDECNSTYGQTTTAHITHDTMTVGDWARGPAGTGEYDYWVSLIRREQQVPTACDWWELPDKSTMIFHIRPGIHWHDKPPVNGREVIGEDWVFTIKRAFLGDCPRTFWSAVYPEWYVDVYTTDKYTVVFKVNDTPRTRTARLYTLMLHFTKLYPPEMPFQEDWRDSLGSGPFMLVDHVPGSSYSFVKNPDYYRDDPLNPENKLPYLDSVKFLLIPDKSTQLASMRTAKIEWIRNVGWEDAESLIETNPELHYKGAVSGGLAWCITGRTDVKPFDDVNVQRALQMAIDYQSMVDDYYRGNCEIFHFPFSSLVKDVFIPLEEYPESIQELFSYNPEKAGELLDAAGYPGPDRFTTSVLTYDNPTVPWIDMLSIVKDNWEDIGVTLELDVVESAIFTSMNYAVEYPQMTTGGTGGTTSGYALRFLHVQAGYSLNYALVDEEYINERLPAIWEWDLVNDRPGQIQLGHEIAEFVLESAYYIPMPDPFVYTFWQPWVQNYHGEYCIAHTCPTDWVTYIWVDEDMRLEMTGK